MENEKEKMKYLNIQAILFFIALLIGNNKTNAQFCGDARSNIFNNGEEIKYKVFYTVAGAWTTTGEAVFKTQSSTYNGRSVFHIVGTGSTYGYYDYIFKVRDKYESYIDKEKLVPLYFNRNVNEGKTTFSEQISFNHSKKTAQTKGKNFSIESCTQDVISAVYFARNINFSSYSVGSIIPVTLFIDKELYHFNIKYLGKTTIKTRSGKFNVIKIQSPTMKGTVFSGNEKITFFISDDANRIPIRIETPIILGAIKIDLVAFKNLKYPFSAKIG